MSKSRKTDYWHPRDLPKQIGETFMWGRAGMVLEITRMPARNAFFAKVAGRDKGVFGTAQFMCEEVLPYFSDHGILPV